MPPSGEPNAAATPAAAPAETKSLLCRSGRTIRREKQRLHDRGPLVVADAGASSCESKLPSAPPMWMSGPSLPMISPAAASVMIVLALLG